MVAFTVVQRLTPNLALIGAGVTGALVALATLAIPAPVLENAVIASGIAAFLAAAEPPLGMTARICVGVFAGGLVAVLLWLALSVLIGIRDSRASGTGARRPSVRRADAHPDAPPREPLRARDLEMPRTRSKVAEMAAVEDPDFDELPAPATLAVEPDDAVAMEQPLPELPPEPVIAMGPPPPVQPVIERPEAKPEPVLELVPPPASQPLPFDLDQPLAAFDPSAIPDVPMAPTPPVAPLLRRKPTRPPVFDAGERFETFELTPHVREVPVSPAPASSPISAPETDASVHALLDRLERGIARRGDRTEPAKPAEPEAHGLESALDALRKLAARA